MIIIKKVTFIVVIVLILGLTGCSETVIIEETNNDNQIEQNPIYTAHLDWQKLGEHSDNSFVSIVREDTVSITDNIQQARVTAQLYENNEPVEGKFYFNCDDLVMDTTDNTATFALNENGEYTITAINENVVNEITFVYYEHIEIKEDEGVSFSGGSNDIFFENSKINVTYGYDTYLLGEDRWQSVYDSEPDQWQQESFTPSRNKIYLIKTSEGYVKGIFTTRRTYPDEIWDFIYMEAK